MCVSLAPSCHNLNFFEMRSIDDITPRISAAIQYLNGDPASSHNHPRVNNWCVPSFSSLLVSEHAHTHRLQQTYAGGPPCSMKVPPVPRCAPERDVWRANVSRGTCSAAQRHARRSFPGQRWRWRHKQSMSREVRIAVTEVIQHAVEVLECRYRGICLLGQGHSRHYGHLCGRIHENKEIRNTLSCLLLSFVKITFVCCA